jgi:hypothetical protein
MHAPRSIVFLLGTIACKGVEPAPKELDRLFPWFFANIDQAEDEQLAEGFRNLHKAADGASLEDTVDGSISDITGAELGSAEVDKPAPALAAGVYMLNRLHCSIGQLERVLSYKDQRELYPDAYETYKRTFRSSQNAWLSEEEHELSWDVDYTATILGKSYQSDVIGHLRRVPEVDADASPFGPTLIARAHIPHPATFEGDGNTSLDQDYQIEMYYRLDGGDLMHAYGIWREADFGGGINSDNESSQRLLLNNLKSWDDETEALCEEGLP